MQRTATKYELQFRSVFSGGYIDIIDGFLNTSVTSDGTKQDKLFMLQGILKIGTTWHYNTATFRRDEWGFEKSLWEDLHSIKEILLVKYGAVLWTAHNRFFNLKK